MSIYVFVYRGAWISMEVWTVTKECYNELDGDKATGIDKITKQEYGEKLDEKLTNLVEQ